MTDDFLVDAADWILTDGRTPEQIDAVLTLRVISLAANGIHALEEPFCP